MVRGTATAMSPLRPRPASVQSALFVLRCTVTAILAYLGAAALDLGHPVWAVVSGLVVSQDGIRETRNTFLWRAAGTLIGAVLAVVCARLLVFQPDRPLPAMATAVAVTATIARQWPALRVAMWTAALILLTASTDHSIVHTAVQRTSEVLLGGAMGAVVHLVLGRIVSERTDYGASSP
ncbi:FUSC family protein [Methylobacterium sp. 10]|uniref:FUSC family protein n=1 Tax=Methylobacterium sp. 10 TaxID=1101191 RepID=UPI0004B8CA32|nr:FUSC family protein [Methylobacterium sp. 10]